MDEIFYDINVEEINLKVEKNSLGYCFSLKSYGQTDVFIYQTLEDSMKMMEHAMTLFS